MSCLKMSSWTYNLPWRKKDGSGERKLAGVCIRQNKYSFLVFLWAVLTLPCCLPCIPNHTVLSHCAVCQHTEGITPLLVDNRIHQVSYLPVVKRLCTWVCSPLQGVENQHVHSILHEAQGWYPISKHPQGNKMELPQRKLQWWGWAEGQSRWWDSHSTIHCSELQNLKHVEQHANKPLIIVHW